MICSLKSSSSAFAATADLLPPKSRMTPTLCFATLRRNSFSPKTPSTSLSSIKPLYLTPLESFGSEKPRGMSVKAKAYEADRSESVAFTDDEARAAAAQKLKISIYFATWWALNVVFNIYNKKVLNAFPYPWLTSTLSLAAGSLIMLLSWAARVTEAPKTDLKFWKALAPVRKSGFSEGFIRI
ncbi:hypothetical protein BHE74_00057880 [Ensete ventricosum]|nr:hypothetical protein BHE74_00057880 [Ensete ventricosum]